jgi:hypothetical protein
LEFALLLEELRPTVLSSFRTMEGGQAVLMKPSVSLRTNGGKVSYVGWCKKSFAAAAGVVVAGEKEGL